MEIVFTDRFEKAYEELTAIEKQNVRKSLFLLGSDSHYPGLHVKKLEGYKSIWEARPSKRLRITFEMNENTLVMRNVGEHDRVLKKP